MGVKASVYVAGLERGVRPMGFWSMRIILSRCSTPWIAACRPGSCRARWRAQSSCLKTMSLISELLPEPETPVTQVNSPRGMRASMFLRLCWRAPFDDQPLAVAATALAGNRDGFLAREIAAREGLGAVLNVARRAAGHQLRRALARPGAKVDDHIGLAYGLFVVLDDDDRVADVAQALEGGQQPLVVAVVQANGRLVEDVQHPDQTGADLRGEADALGLAAGTGCVRRDRGVR